jgi:hypothetical protein
VLLCYVHIHWYPHDLPFKIQVLHIFLLNLTKGTRNCSLMPLVLWVLPFHLYCHESVYILGYGRPVTVHLATRKWYRSDQVWTHNISVFSWHNSVCIIIIIKTHACCTVISSSRDYLLSLSDLSECFWFLLVVSYILSHLGDLQLKDELHHHICEVAVAMSHFILL